MGTLYQFYSYHTIKYDMNKSQIIPDYPRSVSFFLSTAAGCCCYIVVVWALTNDVL